VTPIRSILVDFDGTACPQDVSEALLDAFGDPAWRDLDAEVEYGRIGLRSAIRGQAAMLSGSLEEMLGHALDRYAVDPTFPPFVRWTESAGLQLAVVSDGFAFYIGPMLEAAGVGHLEVLTNAMTFPDGRPTLSHPNGHPVCVGCGTCKMLAARRFRERHGTVAFVGEGLSDRFGALYSDLVFAKDRLVSLCQADRIRYVAWEDFHDVRRCLEDLRSNGRSPPGPLDPATCPGWRTDGGER
jgi:2-hydroxy-3-keto-5-methylthiopentenyl-1-phosphate phosphatase